MIPFTSIYICSKIRWGMPKATAWKVSHLNISTWAWAICSCLHGHMLFHLCIFWHIYIFHLYVYLYLYCIAMIHNMFGNLFLSHHHHHYPSPSDWNRAQMMSVVVWAPGKFLHLLFLYIQLTFYLFLGTALLVMTLRPHHHKPLFMGWLMEQQWEPQPLLWASAHRVANGTTWCQRGKEQQQCGTTTRGQQQQQMMSRGWQWMMSRGQWQRNSNNATWTPTSPSLKTRDGGGYFLY